MRNKIINYFIGEPEETTLQEELKFYLYIGSPLLFVALIIITAEWIV